MRILMIILAGLFSIGIAYAANVTQPAATLTATRGNFLLMASDDAQIGVRLVGPNGSEVQRRHFSLDAACTKFTDEKGATAFNAPAKLCADLAALEGDFDNGIATLAASGKLVPVQ